MSKTSSDVCPRKALPELTIVRTPLIVRKTEDTVVLSNDLLQPIAHGDRKVLVGTYDGAITCEFNRSRRTVNGHALASAA